MRLKRVFLDVDMRMGFDGLRATLKSATVQIDARSTVIFINRAMNSFKLLVNGNYLVYYRNTKRIPLDAIRYLPHNFGGTDLEMREAVKKSLASKLKQEWVLR